MYSSYTSSHTRKHVKLIFIAVRTCILAFDYYFITVGDAKMLHYRKIMFSTQIYIIHCNVHFIHHWLYTLLRFTMATNVSSVACSLQLNSSQLWLVLGWVTAREDRLL